jgi:hypothetical protein
MKLMVIQTKMFLSILITFEVKIFFEASGLLAKIVFSSQSKQDSCYCWRGVHVHPTLFHLIDVASIKNVFHDFVDIELKVHV